MWLLYMVNFVTKRNLMHLYKIVDSLLCNKSNFSYHSYRKLDKCTSLLSVNIYKFMCILYQFFFCVVFIITQNIFDITGDNVFYKVFFYVVLIALILFEM